MKHFLKAVYQFVIPQYITDRVALAKDEDGKPYVYCLEHQVSGDDELYIDAYGTIKTFTWLGFATGGWCKIDDKYVTSRG